MLELEYTLKFDWDFTQIRVKFITPKISSFPSNSDKTIFFFNFNRIFSLIPSLLEIICTFCRILGLYLKLPHDSNFCPTIRTFAPLCVKYDFQIFFAKSYTCYSILKIYLVTPQNKISNSISLKFPSMRWKGHRMLQFFDQKPTFCHNFSKYWSIFIIFGVKHSFSKRVRTTLTPERNNFNWAQKLQKKLLPHSNFCPTLL